MRLRPRQRRRLGAPTWAPLVLLGLVAGCGRSAAPAATLSRAELLNPASCSGCHPSHYASWAQSGHAHAADDPVFVAMNRRGQRDSGGALGAFCISCHAPVAMNAGLSADGLNLGELEPAYRGVTCYFCHNVDAVAGAAAHNNPLHLANDGVMRGGIDRPLPSAAHAAAYSPLHDRTQQGSAAMCGSCHDIVSQGNAHVERTFAEWQASAFNVPAAQGGQSCGACHMVGSATLQPVAAVPGAPARVLHNHQFPGVDVALDPNAGDVAQQAPAVQEFLNSSLQGALCVTMKDGQAALRVVLDNVAGGHGWPSGASPDRRAWVEVVAYQGSQVIYQSGVVPDGTAVTSGADADLWLLRDCNFDAAGNQVAMFWEAAGDNAVESNTLPQQATFDASDPRFYQGHVEQAYPRQRTAFLPAVPDRVTMRVRLQPVGLDVLDALTGSGDLAPTVRQAMPTFDIGSAPLLTWTPATTPSPTSRAADGTVQYCVSNNPSMNLAAQRVPAVNHSRCSP